MLFRLLIDRWIVNVVLVVVKFVSVFFLGMVEVWSGVWVRMIDCVSSGSVSFVFKVVVVVVKFGMSGVIEIGMFLVCRWCSCLFMVD